MPAVAGRTVDCAHAGDALVIKTHVLVDPCILVVSADQEHTGRVLAL